MKKLAAMGAISTVVIGSFSNLLQAQQDLVYVAVDPCRIVDTRNSSGGFINGDTSRNFKIYGDSEVLGPQGSQADCPNPRGDEEPVAVAAYIVATPGNSNPTSNGVVTAYPGGSPQPPKGEGATLNFDQGDTIGNTSIVTVCDENCPDDGPMAILVRETDYHVVIDVQGYFYPGQGLPGREVIERAEIQDGAIGDTGQTTLTCPNNKTPVSAGYSQDSEQVTVLSSFPSGTEASSWVFQVKNVSSGGLVKYYVVCANPS